MCTASTTASAATATSTSASFEASPLENLVVKRVAHKGEVRSVWGFQLEEQPRQDSDDK